MIGMWRCDEVSMFKSKMYGGRYQANDEVVLV